MKQRIRQYGAALLAAVLLILLPADPVYAVGASAALLETETQDPENGILTVSFQVQADAPVTISGDVSVQGGVFLGMIVPGCVIRNKRFVYNAGTQSGISGIIQIGVNEITDITVTVSGNVSSVYDFSTSAYYGTVTVSQDQLSAFVPGNHTEPAPEGLPGPEEYLTLPAAPGPDPGQSARDAAVAEQIRAEQAAMAASEAAENREEADRMRAADASRIADAEAEQYANARQAGVFPREETKIPASDDGDTSETPEASSEEAEDTETEEDPFPSEQSEQNKNNRTTEQLTEGQPRSSDEPQLPQTEEAEKEPEPARKSTLSAEDRVLILLAGIAFLVFIAASVKAALILHNNKT